MIMETRSDARRQTSSTGLRYCKACNKELPFDEYLDHVYENQECYRAYLASEKKEMSKQ
ncbi:MAG TPA: hypothetical protein VFF30_06255 [Nitrososphaerales archaeon]|nr:hypothetical protein [Nitrososphaerales archaeon]